MNKATGIHIARTFGVKGKTKPSSKPKKGLRASKVFVYTLALLALGGGGYLLVTRLRRKKTTDATQSLPTGSSTSITINNGGSSGYSIPSLSLSKGKDSFPLKSGSKGTRVAQLQQALAAILGESVMKQNGGVDGQYGKGTINALKLAGYPSSIDEKTFNKLISSIPSQVTIDFNPSVVAANLYAATQDKDLDGVIQNLQLIKSTAQYSSVNEYYKKKGFYTKTIVSDLLVNAFPNDDAAKDQLKQEFKRIGLKVDEEGNWSLSGIRLYRDLITMRPTILTDSSGNKIPVEKNIILGDQVRVQNGMTWFRSIDNSVLQVPTQDVKFN